MTLITNARVIAPDTTYEWLTYADGQITAIGNGTPPADSDRIDAGGRNVLPGFIDLHIHGALGHDVMDATPTAIEQIALFCAKHGVTGFLPTTLTHHHDALMAALHNIKACMDHPIGGGAAVLGAHIEGPYLNVEKAGAQNPGYIRLATRDEVLALFNVGGVRLIDIAPEFPENDVVLEEAQPRGITVSIAHSSATAQQTLDAIQRGITHSTHTFNAQTPLLHRQPGIVGAVLTSPQVACEIIADGVHVDFIAVKVAWLCKGADGLMLITDAVRPTGMPDGEYPFDERTVILRDGAVRLPDGTLAGSALTYNVGLRNLLTVTGEPLSVLWKTASLNPARAIGLADRKGSLEVGKDADMVIVDDAINVYRTVVNGRTVYTA
jgi:N-acetylglucosamine-6-phosphate deacetylase